MSAHEKAPAEIVAHLRHEARFVEVATAMNDEVTVEYASMCTGAADCIEALTAERDALKAENDKLRQANRDLMEVVKPFAARGENGNPTQVVTLGSCKKARAVYDRLHEVECIILWATP